jgi:O-acetyl-ADP-ribose deacetylase (regulator of RNase III)
VYRINKLKQGTPAPGSPEATALVAEKNDLLTAAYVSALREAKSHGVRTLAFCLLSAGVFRGEQALEVIVGLERP